MKARSAIWTWAIILGSLILIFSCVFLMLDRQYIFGVLLVGLVLFIIGLFRSSIEEIEVSRDGLKVKIRESEAATREVVVSPEGEDLVILTSPRLSELIDVRAQEVPALPGVLIDAVEGRHGLLFSVDAIQYRATTLPTGDSVVFRPLTAGELAAIGASNASGYLILDIAASGDALIALK